MQVHTGVGESGEDRLYLGSWAPMWPSSGGVGELYTRDGPKVGEYRY